MATTIYLIRPEVYPIATNYLLDTYTAAAAYSLRQLKTGVTNVVRVRRSSDNAESDFTADEITDGTLTTWTGANDGFVVTWYDQASTNDATQSTAGNQAQIVLSGSLVTAAGSLPAVDCSTDFYTVSGISVTQEMTQTMVFSRATITIDSIPSINAASSLGFSSWWLASGNTLRAFGSIGDSVTDTGNFLWEVLRDNSNNVSMNLNGTAKTGFVDADTFTATQFLKRYTANYHNGKFQELIFFASNETPNISDIRSDINTYYSVY